MTGCCSKGGGGSGFVAGSVGGGQQPEPKPFDVKVEEDGSIKKQQAPSGRLNLSYPFSLLPDLLAFRFPYFPSTLTCCFCSLDDLMILRNS